MDETFERIAAELAYRPRAANSETRIERSWVDPERLRRSGGGPDFSPAGDDREGQLVGSGWSHDWRQMMMALCPGTRVAAYCSLAAVAVITFRLIGA